MPWHNLSSHLFSISSYDAAAEVELGEEACTLKLVQQLIDDRDVKLVPYSPDVEGAIVDTEQPTRLSCGRATPSQRRATCST
jgi:hypothetical protein